MNNSSTRGLRDGVSIALGYFSVAFAFGIFAVMQGLSPWQAVIVSAMNVTSAGQLAGVPLITGGASVFEVALTQLVINMRYALTSITLSQKLDDSVRLSDRFLIGYMNTDEVFAFCAAQRGTVGRAYVYPLIIPPFFGWTLGTALGAFAGNILPAFLLNALGFAIYGMFISILVPPARASRPILLAELLAAAISCLLYYVPWFSSISTGFSVILASVPAALILSYFAPMFKDEEVAENE